MRSFCGDVLVRVSWLFVSICSIGHSTHTTEEKKELWELRRRTRRLHTCLIRYAAHVTHKRTQHIYQIKISWWCDICMRTLHGEKGKRTHFLLFGWMHDSAFRRPSTFVSFHSICIFSTLFGAWISSILFLYPYKMSSMYNAPFQHYHYNCDIYDLDCAV